MEKARNAPTWDNALTRQPMDPFEDTPAPLSGSHSPWSGWASLLLTAFLLATAAHALLDMLTRF